MKRYVLLMALLAASCGSDSAPPTSPVQTTTTVSATTSTASTTTSPTSTTTTPGATTFSIAGRVTDGTSGGVLPGITVQIVSGVNGGRSAVTNSTGDYTLSGVTAGSVPLSATAAGYQPATIQISLSGNTTVNFVLQRSAPTTTTSTPATTTVGATTTVPGQGATCPVSAAPSGTTAICNDGTVSQSQMRSGTCSSHNGVACWICPGVLCNP